MRTTRDRKFWLVAVLCLLLAGAAGADEYGYGYGSGSGTSGGLSHRFYLGFSLGDGAYFSYKCDYSGGCNTVIAAPVDFEILAGLRLTRNLYLDVAVNWAVDYYQAYYNEVTYLVSVRPGLRFFFPGLFHRFFYLRAALPLGYTIDDARNFVVGLLLGVGIEWRFQSVGLFAEADILPYFLEIYPGYYVIPTQARIGVSAMF